MYPKGHRWYSSPSNSNQAIPLAVYSDDTSRHSELAIDQRPGGTTNGIQDSGFDNPQAKAAQVSPRLTDAAAPSTTKLSRLLSRKNYTLRDEIRRASEVPIKADQADEDTEANKYNRKPGSQRRNASLLSLLPFWSGRTLSKLRESGDRSMISDLDTVNDVLRKRRGKRFVATIDPNNILLFFASISCIGTLILIYYTISIYQREKCALVEDIAELR